MYTRSAHEVVTGTVRDQVFEISAKVGIGLRVEPPESCHNRPARELAPLGGITFPANKPLSAPQPAEGAGFEPAVRLHGLRFSRPVHSTTLPPLRVVAMVAPVRCRWLPWKRGRRRRGADPRVLRGLRAP